MIKIYCGLSIEAHRIQQLHPVTDTNNAVKLCTENESFVRYSNSPDFIYAVKYICQKLEKPVEFFLDDVSQGSDIDKIFESFNEAINIIDRLMRD